MNGPGGMQGRVTQMALRRTNAGNSQREIVARLKRNRPGSETHKQALALLDTLERMQRTHLAERGQLRHKLAEHPKISTDRRYRD